MNFQRKISERKKDVVYYINNSFKPLSPFLKAFALNSNKFQTQKYTIATYFTFIIPILVLVCLNVLSMYYKITDLYYKVLVSIKYTDAFQVAFDFFQYTVDLYYIYSNGKNMQVYFNTHQKIDDALGCTYCPLLKKNLVNLIVFFGLSWTITCVCDYCAWWYSAGFKMSSVFSISYIFILIKILTSLDLTSHVMQIEFRLRYIAETTQSWLDAKVKVINVKTQWYTHLGKHSPDTAERFSEDILKCERLSKSYLWLIEQVDFINKMFGTRILLNSLSLLIDIVRFTNIAVRILLGSQHLDRGSLGLYPVISTLMRIFTCIAILFSMVRRCELTYRQRDRIIDIIDHFNIIKESRQDLSSVLNELQRLVRSRPIDFRMSNLTRLDYSLLSSMASMVVTYTVILLQSVN